MRLVVSNQDDIQSKEERLRSYLEHSKKKRELNKRYFIQMLTELEEKKDAKTI